MATDTYAIGHMTRKYLTERRAAGQITASTHAAYREWLSYFVSYVGSLTGLGEIDPAMVNGWIDSQAGLSRATVRHRVTGPPAVLSLGDGQRLRRRRPNGPCRRPAPLAGPGANGPAASPPGRSDRRLESRRSPYDTLQPDGRLRERKARPWRARTVNLGVISGYLQAVRHHGRARPSHLDSHATTRRAVRGEGDREVVRLNGCPADRGIASLLWLGGQERPPAAGPHAQRPGTSPAAPGSSRLAVRPGHCGTHRLRGRSREADRAPRRPAGFAPRGDRRGCRSATLTWSSTG